MDVENDDDGGPPTRAQYALEVHKQAHKATVTRKVLSRGRDQQWTADHMVGLPKEGGATNLLVLEDVFSRYCWAVPTKSLDAATTLKLFNSVIKSSGRSPQRLWTDAGGSFTGDQFKKPLEKEGIVLFHTYGPHKAVLVERLNGTLGRNLYREMTAHNTRDWTSLIDGVVDKYNHTAHSSLHGLTPAEASEPSIEEELHHKLYDAYLARAPIPPRFALGTWVRVSRDKGVLEHDTRTETWSTELYKIVGIKFGAPPVYTLADNSGESLVGSFYEAEMQQSAFSPTTQQELIAPRVKPEDVGPDQVARFVGWRENGRKVKFPFDVHAQLGDGSKEWIDIALYIGKTRKNGQFYATTSHPDYILRPLDTYVQSIPRLKAAVWDKI